jgi:hypothetical protein
MSRFAIKILAKQLPKEQLPKECLKGIREREFRAGKKGARGIKS